LIYGSYPVKKVSAIASCKICNETNDKNLFLNFITFFCNLGKSLHCNERIAFLIVIENGFSYFSSHFYLTSFWPILSDILIDKISNVKCFLLKILPSILRKINNKDIEDQIKEIISVLIESKIKLEKEIAENINIQLMSLDMSTNFSYFNISEEQKLSNHEDFLLMKNEQVIIK